MRWQRAWAAWWDLGAERATSRSVEGPACADGPRRALEAYELEDRTLLSATPLPADLLAADLPADGGGDSSAATDGSAAAAEAADAATNSTTATLDDAGPNGDAAAAGDFDASAALAPAAEDAPADGPAVELVFVQDSIRDLDQLLAGLIDQLDAERTLEVVVLDSSADGLDQVSQALAARRDVAAVHFVTHGADGMARLGGSWLDAATLNARFEQIERWAEALTDDADLVFYGCDLAAGEAGQDLVERLSALTGADVAASTDATGQAALGGDWDFEYRVGDVDTGLAFSTLVTSEWQGRLATYVVTNTNNSGAGSLRQAIIDANNNAGADIISFNISGTGTHTIGLSTALPTITGTVTIDATTDDSFAANGNRPAIVLDGGYNFTGDGFVLTSTADGSVIRGFVIRKFSGDGIEIQAGSDNNVVAGNYIGRMTTSGTDLGSGNENTGAGIRVLGANNTIGGTTAANRNVVSGNSSYGILITGAAATGNVVSGNYVGLTAAGTATLGNSSDGVRVEASANNNTIGGSTTAHRNVISGNSDGVQLTSTSGNVVRNNYIGTDWTGTVDLGNTDDGVDLDSNATNNQILDNLISGNNSDGIDLGDSGGDSSGTLIRGNLIGTQANGTSSLANTGHGILIGNGGTVTSATIGGVNAGEGNTIAYNGGDGIYVSSGSGITIRGNSSFGNTGLAIDLGTNGVTVNDTGDGDTGANALQNFPVLTYAYTSGSTVVLSGSLNSTASGTFTLDFYTNGTVNANGYCEGRTYLGSTTVVTNGSGNATFSGVTFSAAVSAGTYVVATATNNTTGNTSEFGLAKVAVTNSLWLSTTADVTGSGVPGLDAWDEGQVIQFGPPQFELQPANLATDGNLASVFDLNNFAAGVNIDALEYVTRTITIGSGGNTLTLQAGDVLLSLDGSATLTSSNSLSVTADEVFLFRPTVAGVYTSGTFTMVLDNFGSIHGGGDTWAIALVEQNTTIGDYTVSAGSFLFSRQGAAEHGDIRLFTPTGVGAGTTSGTVQKLVEGSDSGVGISTKIYGLELVETAITVGGVNLAAGTILMAVDAADTVGSNNVSVAANDVFALTFSTTTLGSGTSSATASLLFDGSDVNLSSASENLDGLALFSVTNTAPTLSAAQSPVLTAQNEDSGAPSGAVGTLVSALIDFASPSGQVDNVTDPDPGALLGIAITAADTTNGAWFYSTDGGSNWNALGAVSSASARLLAADASTRVYFQPNANYNGTLSSGLTFRAWDRTTGTAGGTADTSTNGGITAFSTATDTASLTVNAVNDAPVHTVPGAQSVSEDGALVFSAAGGNLISINDVDAGSSSVQVTLTVTNGTLNLAGTTGLTFSTGDGNADATMTFTGSQTDVNAALASLSYSPTQNYTGAATLTVTTSDLGNSGSGGAQSDTDNVAITVNAVNDTPLVTTTGSTLAYTENNAATPVDPGLVVSDVEGTLTGATVTISSNYASGQDVLAFTNQLGITGSWDSGTGTLTLTGTTTVANYQTALRSVTYQNTNDAPSTATRVVTFVVNDGTVNSNAGAQSTLLSTGFSGGTAGFTYVDDPFGTSDPTKADGNHAASGGFTDGALRVYLGPGPNTAAVSGGWSTTFTVANAGEVIVSVRYRMTMGEGFETDEYGEVVLAVDGTRYGSDTNSSLLHVDGNDNGGGSENSGWRQATVRMNLTAGNHTLTLGAYNNKATASDEWVEAFFDDVTVSEASNVRPISVTAVNDAPVLDNAGTMTLTAITEDQTSNAGDTVASILASAGGDRVTDVDAGAVEGIALTATASGNGTWEYSTDGGSNWNAVGAVANNSALLLRASDRLRFVPDGLNADAASVSFRAWDQTSGTAGAKVDASTTGGSTAFSTATETASISVTAVNDAPVLDNAGTMTLTTVSENNTSSATVATVIASAGGDRITDSDTGAVEGIAITAINSGNGTWRYSTDGGSNWSDVGAVSNTSALLLRSTDLIAYAGNGQNGGTADFTFRAWDQTSGAAGAKVDASTTGGTTAFSTATETASITTTSVNDAPVLDNAGTMTLTAITEDQTTNAGDTVAAILASAGGDRVTDVDSGAVEGIAITATASGNGTWEYSTDGGSNWNAVGTVANNSALLLRASDRLRFVPDGLNADAASVSFRAWDQTSGTAGAKVDASTTGGTTAFSTATETAAISVTAVNDAPTLNAAQSPALTAQIEDSGAPSGAVGTLVSTLVDFASPAGQVDNVTDPDSGALLGIAITAADTTNGVWFYSTDGGSNWNALGAVSDASARLLTADANTRVYFQPNANYNGTISNAITFRAWDQTSGANGATADTTTNGGITAFSTATDTASLTISAVNDAPTATITPASYTVNEQTTLTLHGTGLSIADVDAGGTAVQATVSVVSGTLTAAAGTTGVSVSGSGTSSVTLSGTLTQINNLLAGASGGTLTYTLNSDTPPASDTLTLGVSDLGNSGSGGTLTGSDTATINLTAVNDAPMNTVPGVQSTAVSTPLVFNAAGGNLISTSDADVGGSSLQITLTATNGLVTLGSLAGLSFTTGDGTADAVMTFTGTLANVNAALDGLSFNPTAGYSGAASLEIVTSDQGNTGTGGALTATDTIGIQVGAYTFRQGDNGYTGTEDTELDSGSPNTAKGGNTSVVVDLNDGSGQAQGLIQFANLFGSGPGQIPIGATINSATLTVYVTDIVSPSDHVYLHRMLTAWSEASTWNSLTGGIQTNDVEAMSTADADMGMGNVGFRSFTVTAAVQAWADGAANHGWAILSDTTDGWAFNSSEHGTVSQRPYLTVSFTPPQPPAIDLDLNNSSGASGANYNATWTEDGGARLIADADAVVTDADDTQLVSMTVTITNLQDGALESLTANTAGTGITAAYDSGTGVLSLTGTDTVANYQQVLRTVAYNNTSQNPNSTVRTITVVAYDGLLNSSTATTTLAISAVNDAPVNAVPGAQSVTEDGSLTFSSGGGNAVSVSDIDLAGGSLQVTLTGTGGVVTLSGTSGLSFSVGDGAADATMTFSGSAANINAALNGLAFTTAPDFTGAGSLQIVTSDLGNTGTGGPQTDSDTVNITVNAVNDAPTATITPASYTVNEQTTLTLHGTGLSIADVDAGGAAVQATVSVVSGTLTAAAGTTGVSVSGSGTSSVTLSGTLTQINNLLAGASGGTLTYTLNSDTPPASDTLTLQASDLGNAGSGGTLTGSDTATINLTAVNDAPVHTVPGPQVTAEDTPLVFNAAGGNLISIGDVDAGGAAVQVTLSATGGTLTLSGTAGLTFSTGDGTGDASMQFSGTLVDVNAALNGLTFNPTPDFTGGAGIGIVTSDLGSAGTGGPQTDTDAISINVTAVNDPPTLGFPGPDLNYTENDGPSELDTTATVADIDSPDFATGTLTVAFTANGQAEDRLAVRHQGTGPGQVGVSGGNVTYGGVTVGSWSGGTSGATPLVVTFNANATAAVVQAVARAVTYENVSDTPSTLTRTWQATLTDGDGGTSTPVTGNIFLTAVNDVPVITSNGGGPTANVNVAENSTAVTTVTATDLDLPTQTLAYSISGGADAGRFTIDSGTGALSFSTAPDREAATDANGDHVYEVTVQVSDGAGGTDTQTLFVTVTDVDEFNVGPVSDANAAADLVAENAANGTLVGLTAQATDADATTSAITYSLDDSAGGRFTIDSATGVVTVANGGLLDYEAATSHDITVRATSADGSSSTRTFTIALGPVNDNAPVITSNGGGGSASVTVAENTTAVTTVAATDADLPAQTVSYSISGGADAGRFTIDSATGALTFSAPPDFENPLDADGDNVYEVTVQASDGAGGADTQNLSVSVSNTNEAPVATIGPATYAVDEQVTLTLHGTGLALADVDAGANPIQATVSVVSGTLTAAAGTTGVTVLGSGTSSVTLSGTVAQINDLLAGNLGGTLTYVLSSDTPPAGDTLTLQVNDQGHSGAGGPLTASDTATINITALNDAPVNSVPGSQNMTEDGTLVFSSAGGNLISVADVDVGAGTVQLTLSVTSGTLTLSGTTGLAFSAGDGSADAGMQFTGTLVDVNAALAGLTYAPLANFAGADQLTITVDDLGSTGSGGPQTDTDTVAIAVAAVNDAPTLSAPATVNTAFQAPVTFAASLGRAILPGDVDAAAAAVEVRLTATSGVLSLGQPGAVTIVSGSASGGSTVVFQGTVSDVAQALEGLVYTPDATFRGAAQLQVDVDDLGNSGSGGPLTAAATVVIDVAPAAQRLTLVAPAQVSTTNFAALFSNASGFSLVVVDAYGEDALVTLSLTASAGQIVLSQSTGLVFLAGSGAPSAQVVVEGSLSAVNAALDGAQFLLGANLGTLDVSVVDTPRDPGPAHSAASQVMILQSLAPAPPPPPVDDTLDTDTDDAEDSDDTLPDAVPLQGLLDQRDGPTTVFEFADRSGPARSEGPATHADVAAPRRLLAFANETLADGALTGVEWQPDLGEVLLLARGPLSTTAIAALDATGAIPWELLVSDVERGVAALGFDDWETGVVSVTAAASLGYVLWTVRAGTLLTSLFYAMPAWRSFDVLPVIDSFDKQPVRRQGSGPEHDLDLAGLVDRNLSLPAKN